MYTKPSNQRLKFNKKDSEKQPRNQQQKRKSTDSRGQKNLAKLSQSVNQSMSSELLPKKKYASLRVGPKAPRRP